MNTLPRRLWPCLAALLWLAPLAPLRAATLGVPAQYPTIQAGINAAQPGDTVLVSDGTYTGPGNVDLDSEGKSLTVASVNGASTTIIDCQGSSTANHRAFYFHSNETVTVSGLTIKNGDEAGGGGAVDVESGSTVTLTGCTLSGNTGGLGGAVANGGTATLTGCVLTGNTTGFGGGMNNSGAATLTGCTLSGNTASEAGGIYNSGTATLTNCAIHGNTAVSGVGGGLENDRMATLTGCSVSNNTAASGGGGGVYNNGQATLTDCAISSNVGGGVYDFGVDTLTRCTISGNTASYGGGITIYGTTTLTGCVLSRNTASSGGGGVENDGQATLTDCLLVANAAGGDGGGVENFSTLTLQFCSLSGNSAQGRNPQGMSAQGGALLNARTATLTDDVLWGDTAPTANTGEVGTSTANGPATATVTYSDIQGGYGGAGNINADPLFVNAARGDLHLRIGSPVLGAGTPVSGVATDKDGEIRPKTPSIGAYERPLDDATTIQINPAHTGAVTTPGLSLPLARKWTATLSGPTSYALIAAGKVFVTASTNNPNTGNYGYGTSLYALDTATGQTVWGPISLGGTYYTAYVAYDEGRVFAVTFDGLLRAFDAAAGALLWSTQLPGQYAFSASPTARDGVVYVGGAGSGGTLYAVDEATGAVQWTQGVENGDDSSPTVTDSAVYVNYSGPQTYAFDLLGNALWHNSPSGSGGGGTTAAFYNGQLFVPDDSDYNHDGALKVLDPATGGLIHAAGTGYLYDTPAFDSGRAFVVGLGGGMEALDAASLGVLWSDSQLGQSLTAPLVVNGSVFVAGAVHSSGAPDTLWALDPASGQVLWSDTPPSSGGSYSYDHAALLNAGESLLLFPAGNTLVAYAHLTPSWTATAVSAGGDGYTRILWDRNDGAAAVWKVDAGGNYVGQQQYGPYPGWTAKSIATGKDSQTRVLWTRTDGRAAFWVLDANNNYVTQQQYGPYQGWSAVGVAAAPDGTGRALWVNADGTATVWTLDGTGHFMGRQQYGPYAGWTAKSLAVCPDGTERLLWANADGTATFWRLDSSGQFVDRTQYGPYAGWAADSISAAPDGTGRVVWINADGRIALWDLDATNNYTGQTQYGPYGGWGFQGLSVGADGNSRLLWDNVGGQADLWDLTPSGQSAAFSQFGPY